jgi:uncharacterized membrane protein YqjE
MAQSERSAILDKRNTQDLPSLLERLAGDLATLFDQKVTLLKIEVKEDVAAYVRGSIAILAGAVVATVGFALLNVALAFGITTLLASLDITQPAKYALGFVITGVIYLALGGIAIVLAKNRLARQGLMPKQTIRELEKDKEWIQKEM